MILFWNWHEIRLWMTRHFLFRKSWEVTNTGKRLRIISYVCRDFFYAGLPLAILLSCRKAFLRKRGAALTIQKTWRGHKVRKVYRVVSCPLTADWQDDSHCLYMFVEFHLSFCRSSWALPVCGLKCALVRWPGSINKSDRQLFCFRVRLVDIWRGGSGNERERRWSSCRLTPEEL